MSPIEAARATLGEHYKNYVIIVQDDDNPSLFDMAFSCPYATTGLLMEASKYQHSLMNAMNHPEEVIEWVEDEEADEEEPDF